MFYNLDSILGYKLTIDVFSIGLCLGITGGPFYPYGRWESLISFNAAYTAWFK